VCPSPSKSRNQLELFALSLAVGYLYSLQPSPSFPRKMKNFLQPSPDELMKNATNKESKIQNPKTQTKNENSCICQEMKRSELGIQKRQMLIKRQLSDVVRVRSLVLLV
jgi:hypothetical protein